MRKRAGKEPRHPKNVIASHISPAQMRVCSRCGQAAHAKKMTCPAMDKECHRCNKKGHFKKMCRTKLSGIETTEEQKEFLGTIQVDTANSNIATSPWTAPIKANERVVNFKIDTGADVTVIPTKQYDSVKDGPLMPVKKR